MLYDAAETPVAHTRARRSTFHSNHFIASSLCSAPVSPCLQDTTHDIRVENPTHTRRISYTI